MIPSNALGPIWTMSAMMIPRSQFFFFMGIHLGNLHLDDSSQSVVVFDGYPFEKSEP